MGAQNVQVIGTADIVNVVSSIGNSIGSAIGQLIGGRNPFAQVAGGTLLGALGSALANDVGSALTGGDLSAALKSQGDQIAANFGESLPVSFEAAGVGVISSQLTNDILHSIGVTGFGGQLASVVLNNAIDGAITFEINSIFNLAVPLPGPGSLSSNLLSFFGQQLGQLVISPTTEAGAVLGSLGSTIGSEIGSLFGPIGTVIGAFIGDVIGTLFGDLFGHKKPRIPTATASVVLQLPNANYALGSTSSANGGDLNFVVQMANAASTTLNGIINEIVGATGLVANGSSPTQTYGLTGSQLYVTLGGTQYNESTGNAAVDTGVIWAIKQTELIGGNIFAKRAIANSTAPNTTVLLADLQVAADFLTYRQNYAEINAEIAANPNSAFTAGWIETFQRANELNLDAWNASDFYGGLQGFLSSFGLGDMASGPHYENITIGWDGSNFFTGLPSAIGGGVFSVMPNASSDGSSLQINSFLQTFGYNGYGANAAFRDDAGSSSAWTANLSSSSTNDILIGGNGGNTITAGSGYAWIQGGSGTDTLNGGSGYDVIIAGSGAASVHGGSGGGYFAAGSGTDSIYTGSVAATTIVGGTGSSAVTAVVRGSGNTTFIVAPQNSWAQITGTAGGSSTVSFERYTFGINVSLANHPSFLTSAWSDPTASYLYDPGVFAVAAQNTRNLIGSNYNDVLQTSEQGGTLEGLGGADQLIGGGGITTASYQHSAAGVYVDLSASSGNLVIDPLFNSPSTDWQSLWTNTGLSTSLSTEIDDGMRVLRHQTSGTPSAGLQMNTGALDSSDLSAVTQGASVEAGAYISASGVETAGLATVVDWYNSSFTYLGSAAAGSWTGSGGSFSGGLATAKLEGGVVVAPTNAAYAVLDIVALSSGAGPLNVALADPVMEVVPAGTAFNASFLQTGAAYGGDATGDTFSNIQNLLGSNYDDELKGLAGSALNGGAGDDTLDYSGGSNQYIGGDAFDTVDYSLGPNFNGSGDGVNVNLNTNVGNWDAAGDTYSSIEKVVGTLYTDYIYGTSTGTTFDGGGGNDYLYGGAGSDTYVFNNNYGVETVNDSSSASNTVQFGAGISFDDLWIGTQGGSSGYLQIGIRGQSGYVQVIGNFGASTSNNVIKTLDMDGAGQVDIGQITYGVGGSDSADTLDGPASYYNLIFAYGGNDTIYAQNNQVSNYGAVIDAGLGNDTIYASNGDDQYLFERGDGQDTIYDTGGQNTVVFGPTVAADDIIYQIIGNDLYIGIRNLNNSSQLASQVSDNMRIVGGGVIYQNQTTGSTTQNTINYVIAGGTTVNLQSLNLPWTVVATGGSGGGGGGGHPTQPIVLDLYGDGLQITPVANSDIVAETASGIVTRMGWVGPDDGILAVDRSGDGQINTTADISFVQDKAGATTDLQGLAGWDTNGDGVLNAEDANWGKLLVWVDQNQDGVAETGEVQTLDQAGITSINLGLTPTGFDGSDTIDSYIENTTTFSRSDGTTGTAYDVALAQRFLTASGIENAPDVTWDQVTGNQIIGRLLNDPMAIATGDQSPSPPPSTNVLKAQTAALATVGQAVGGAQITETELSQLADVDFGPGQTISASDATLWSDFLDPAKNVALKASIAAGMSGSDLLNLIKTTTAYPVGAVQLTGRGIAKVAARAAEPIVIDFSGAGPSLTDASDSMVKLDVQHTGVPEKIGWVGRTAGILAYDLNGDGKVDPTSEISFAAEKPGAKTSIQGLAAYDTNSDGVINALDSSYAKFLVWRDANGDGVSDPGETQTLQQAGISSISLQATNTVANNKDVASNQVLGQITVSMSDGTTRIAYDTALGVADASAAKPPVSTAPSTPTVQSPPIEIAALPTPSTINSVEAASSAATSGLQANTIPTTVTASRLGEDGPEGAPSQAVVTNAAVSDASGWWAPGASSTGSILDSITPMTLAGGSATAGAAQGAGMVAASQDAASAQRQLLLQQSLAAFQAGAAGTAAIWARQTAGQSASILTASSSQTTATQAPPIPLAA